MMSVNEDFSVLLVCFIVVMFLLGLGYECGSAESDKIINQLCNQKQYDFCVLKEKTYVLKGTKDE